MLDYLQNYLLSEKEFHMLAVIYTPGPYDFVWNPSGGI